MKVSLPTFPKLKTKRGWSMAVIAVLIVGLLIYGGVAYFGNTHTSYRNASGMNTIPSKSSLKTTNANATGTISVPCGCKKQTTGQPGQTSTSGSTLQGGYSQPTQSPSCNPCAPSGGTESEGVMCPEYLCRAPSSSPTPAPTPTPTPPPPPHCAPCGGFREGSTTSAGYACPMYCME